jgi:cephalosporin-C deacetylase-like acetyl esterase
MALASGTTAIEIPSGSGELVIDGSLDDAFWRNAKTLEVTAPSLTAVESRIGTRGGYLCLSARVPETDRVVAHSTGRNPTWWQEDLVTWNIRVQDRHVRRHLSLTIAINPFGAYRLDGASGLASLDGEGRLLAAARVTRGEWTVEAAIPMEDFGPIGFLDLQRIRAPRPDSPEVRTYWPAPNERATIQFAASTGDPAPAFSPMPRPMVQPAAFSDEFSWIPKNAWTDEQRNRLQPSQMLKRSLQRRMTAAAEKERLAWKNVNSQETWERFRDERLAALREWMGPMPTRTPLHATVTRRINPGRGFVIENLVYESRPHLLVTANLYLPENPAGRIPAVLMVHSHHAPKTQSELQDLGMTWARAGTAVLIPDQLCAGERIQSQPWPRESYYGRYSLGIQLLLAGESLMKWMVWDLMRSVDLLVERPEIDPRRIVFLGAVAGGGDPAAVTAALDSRIAAVIPFNFGEAGPEEHYTDGPRPYDFETASPGWGEWETTRSLPHSASGQYFPWFLTASVAPRPFLYSFEIGWPDGVEHEPAWARYKRVFALYGARDHLDEVHGFGPFPGPGECTNVGTLLRKRIYPVLHRWLDIPVPEVEYHEPVPDSELICLTLATAREWEPKPASALVLGIAQKRLSTARSRKPALDDMRAALRRKLGDVDPNNPVVTPLWAKSSTGITVEAIAVETEPGITLPVYFLKPEQAPSQRIPAVLAVAQGGKQRFLSERTSEIMRLLRNGVAVCLPDVRGTGETAATPSRQPGAMDLAVTELMLGGTLPGAQLKDARTVLHYLASRPDIEPSRIALWGDSFAPANGDEFALEQSQMQEPGPFAQQRAEPIGPLLVLLVGVYESKVAAIATRSGLVSFLSVLEDRFSNVPEDAVVPGILVVADIADIIQAQSPRPVLTERSVDGRNRLSPAASAGASDVAEWLSAQLQKRK